MTTDLFGEIPIVTRGGMTAHHNGATGSDVWLTPPDLLAELGPFDLDPCAAPEPRPWPTAAKHYVAAQDGLRRAWSGRVWLNPPYSDMERWLARLAGHGDGLALIFARTDTRVFHRQVWERASALLFLEGRLNFCRPNGVRAKANSGGPSVLVAYGADEAARLAAVHRPGAYVRLTTSQGPQ